MGTDTIKKCIPTWLTKAEMDSIRCGYETSELTSEPFFTNEVKRVSNWKRMTKYKEGNDTVRIFDNIKFDGTLRLYVTTDSADAVVDYSFEIE